MRGTIGGNAGENLTPIDIVEMAAAFGQLIKKKFPHPSVVIGRDARVSGEMVASLCAQTLIAQGFHVYDAGLSTTPTIEMAVTDLKASAGIIVTASHNPGQWNALKFLNDKGEFISGEEGQELIKTAHDRSYIFNEVADLGKIELVTGLIQKHIDHIFALKLVDVELVKSKKYKVVVDCINSTGTISIKPILEQLGCEVILINEEMSGIFAHNPEPLQQHLTELCEAVLKNKADLGIAVDPDVDRLSFICPDGTLLGEENTLVAIADYILQNTPGSTVSNLSSTRGLRDVTEQKDLQYFAAAVGEVNVVSKMKAVNAVIGGEGNGGIIYPELHYGRDALVGVALMLTYLATENKSLLDIKTGLPLYFISKNKIDLQKEWNVKAAISQLIEIYKEEEINVEDGLKIDFEDGWVQLRLSNTEPIIRVYSESSSIEKADALAGQVIEKFNALVSN